jgi:pyruvate kinase
MVSPMERIRRTKILVTLGPSTDPPGVLGKLIDAGIDAVRFNLSHGTHEEHARRARALRREAARRGRHIPILLDLSGPKIRVGELPPGGLDLPTGSTVRLVPGAVAPPGATPAIPVPVAGLLDGVRKGSLFLLKDGLLRFRAVRVRGGEVTCEVEEGGLLKSRQGIARPGTTLPLPAITAKDRRDIRFGLSMKTDAFALSFVGSANDVRRAGRLAGDIPVIAKIERPEAVEQAVEIIESCAGVMVARGDLGVELGPAKLPLIQKEILREANRRGRLAILATQILASMEQSPVPTRAEATDVANAVLDGADGLLLTGETAGGRYPVHAVRQLDDIIREVEESELYRTLPAPSLVVSEGPGEALAAAAAQASRELGLAGIVVLTRSGRTAGLLSDHRPPIPIVAVTHDAATARRLAFEWGVVPAVAEKRAHGDLDAALRCAACTLGLPEGRWLAVLHRAPDGEAWHLTLAKTLPER